MRETQSASVRSTPATTKSKTNKSSQAQRSNTKGGAKIGQGSGGPSNQAGTNASKDPKTSKSKPVCENPECTNSNVIEDEGKLVCASCGYLLQEAQITQELTFGETANGRAVVQGTYVGANETTARNHGAAGRHGEGMNSRDISKRSGNYFLMSVHYELLKER